MKCIQCGRNSVEERVEHHRYTESGLENVVLANIKVRHCQECGENEYVIPDIEGLHACLANTIASKAERLLPVKFLRKYLGLCTKDFAAKIGVRPETVSRWERSEDPQSIALPMERFLRCLVFCEKPATYYPRANLEETAVKKQGPTTIRVKASAHGWQPEEVRAE